MFLTDEIRFPFIANAVYVYVQLQWRNSHNSLMLKGATLVYWHAFKRLMQTDLSLLSSPFLSTRVINKSFCSPLLEPESWSVKMSL